MVSGDLKDPHHFRSDDQHEQHANPDAAHDHHLLHLFLLFDVSDLRQVPIFDRVGNAGREFSDNVVLTIDLIEFNAFQSQQFVELLDFGGVL